MPGRLRHGLASGPNLVVVHGAHIANSTHNEPEQVGRREVFREVPVRVCERPRPLRVDELCYLPCAGVGSSATVHDEEDPSRGTHRLPKWAHLPCMMAGLTSTFAIQAHGPATMGGKHVRRTRQTDEPMSREHDRGA